MRTGWKNGDDILGRKEKISDHVTLEVLISTKERAILQYAILMVASLTLFFVSIFYVALALGVLAIHNTIHNWLGWGGAATGSLCVILPGMGLIFGLMGTFAGIIGMGRTYSSLRKLKAMDEKEIEFEEMKYALRRELMIGNIDDREYGERLARLEERYK